MTTFREALPTDLQDILRVHRAAFQRAEEAELVAELLQDPSAQPMLSLCAVDADRVVGHVLFSTVRLQGDSPSAACALMAPLAVQPSHQRAGVGRGLIEHGCRLLFDHGTELVFVLGDPAYYGRCGFVPAIPLGLQAPYAIEPEEAWRVRAPSAERFGILRGTVESPRALAAEHYWRE